MQLKLICVGKLQKDYLKEGVADFQKRLSHYLTLTIVDLKEASNKDQESEHIAQHIESNDTVIVCDERGSSMSSPQLAQFLEKCQLQGKHRLVMVLGGAYGVSETLKKRAQKILSFSPMTFPHQLARLILLEQLYRAMTIIKKEPYHHS